MTGFCPSKMLFPFAFSKFTPTYKKTAPSRYLRVRWATGGDCHFPAFEFFGHLSADRKKVQTQTKNGFANSRWDLLEIRIYIFTYNLCPSGIAAMHRSLILKCKLLFQKLSKSPLYESPLRNQTIPCERCLWESLIDGTSTWFAPLEQRLHHMLI